MKFRIREISIEPKDIVIISRLNNENVVPQARFRLSFGQREIPINQVLKVEDIVGEDEIGLSHSLIKNLGAHEGDEVLLQTQTRSLSTSYSLIKQRIVQPGKTYDKAEIDQIIGDITSGVLSPLESSVFITSQIFQ